MGRLLGFFVVFQFVYLPLSNYIKMVPVRIPEQHGELTDDQQRRRADTAPCREPFQTIVDTTSWCCSRWADVSGQIQCWALFASCSERASFPIVELHWPDDQRREPVRITSHFQPSDATNYFFWPEPCCRVWNYEYRMTVFHMAATRKLLPDDEQYRRLCLENVRDMRRSMSAYLRFKVDRYLAAHPGTPRPDHATLLARIMPNPSPGQSYRDRPPAFDVPVARWVPDSILQAWDTTKQVFVGLPIEEAR